MLKKLIVFILALSFSLSSAVYASDFGILESLDIGAASAEDRAVTRGEYIDMVAKIMNLDQGSAELSLPYKDIDSAHPYFTAIGALSKLGIINGDSNGNVNPDSPITWNQAVKIILSAMGYSVLCEAYGGYPVGYTGMADRIDLLDGLAYVGESELSYNDALSLLQNAVDINIYEQTGFGADWEFEVSDDTLLSRYHKIYMVKDVVIGTGFKNSDPYTTVDTGCVKVGDYVYRDNGLDFNSLVGHSVKLYYKEDGSNRLAVAVLDNESENKITSFSLDDISDVKGNVITYYDENDKERKLNVSEDSAIIYNNAPADRFVKADFDGFYGSVEYIEQNDGKNKSTLVIECWRDFAVSAVDTDKGLVFDKYTGAKLDISNDDNLVFIDEYGNKMDIIELAEYDVISALVSKTGDKVEARYSNTELRGSIEEVNSSDDCYILKIGGEYYETNKTIFEECPLKIGDSGLFVLNYHKEIASYRRIDGNTVLWGYLIGAAANTSSLDGKYQYKILTENSEVVIYDAADKIYFDSDTTRSTPSAVYAALLGGDSEIQPRLIRYKANKNNEITYIDTPSENAGDNELGKFYTSGSALQYRQTIAMFEAKIPISGNTVAFCVPNPDSLSADDDDYRVYNATKYFVDEKSYEIEAYRLDNTSHYADALVCYVDKATSTDHTSSIMIVGDVTVVASEEHNSTCKVTGYNISGSVETVTETVDAALAKNKTGASRRIATGDVIRYARNEDGEITYIDLVYDSVRNEMVISNPSNSEELAHNRLFYGKAYSMDRGNVYLTNKDMTGNIGLDDVESYNASVYTIYVYDKSKREPVYSGSVSDITTYLDTANPVGVLTFAHYGIPRFMYVIK